MRCQWVNGHCDLGRTSHGGKGVAEAYTQDLLPESIGHSYDGGEVSEEGVVVSIEEDEGGDEEEEEGEEHVRRPHAARLVVEYVEEVIAVPVEHKREIKPVHIV